jgi:hypothetical protein
MSEAQVPFKVFLSLLDKWEIGEALSEKLAIPSLEAIRAASAPKRANASEVVALASAVYEAVEPSLLWKRMHADIDKELADGGTKHLRFLLWVLTAIPQHDDEATKVHIPIMLERILDGIADRRDEAVVGTCLSVADALLSAIPPSLFMNTSDKEGDAPASATDLAYVDVDLNAASAKVQSEVVPKLVQSIFKLSQRALRAAWQPKLLVTIVMLTQRLIDWEVPALADVDSHAWIAAVLVGLDRVHSFAVVANLVDVALKASRLQLLNPPIDITDDRVMPVVLDTVGVKQNIVPNHSSSVISVRTPHVTTHAPSSCYGSSISSPRYTCSRA